MYLAGIPDHKDRIETFSMADSFQVIPGNDQNTSPINQKTAGSKVERTSKLMFYGSRRHLKSFQVTFCVDLFTRMSSHIPGEKSGI